MDAVGELPFSTTAGDRSYAALEEALVLDGIERIRTVRRMARSWARRDAEAALAMTSRLPAQLQADFQSDVSTEWAFVDPAGFFAHAETAGSLVGLLHGLEVLIATDPTRVWEITRRTVWWGERQMNNLHLAAVRAMVLRDPANAASLMEFDDVPRPQRDAIRRSIAQAYASVDPAAGLTWASRLDPPSSQAFSIIIEAVASTDLIEAYDQATILSSRPEYDQTILLSNIVRSALRGGQQPVDVANALASRPNADAGRLLADLMRRWTDLNTNDAVEWLIANQGSANVQGDAVKATAQKLGELDFDLAMTLTDRMPQTFRGGEPRNAELAGG